MQTITITTLLQAVGWHSFLFVFYPLFFKNFSQTFPLTEERPERHTSTLHPTCVVSFYPLHFLRSWELSTVSDLFQSEERTRFWSPVVPRRARRVRFLPSTDWSSLSRWTRSLRRSLTVLLCQSTSILLRSLSPSFTWTRTERPWSRERVVSWSKLNMCNTKIYIYIYTYTCVILRSNNIFVLLILSFVRIKEKRARLGTVFLLF